MLLKFFSVNGGDDEPGGLDYLLKNPTARVVRGNPELTRWVINKSPSGLRQRFSAGVINDLTELDRRHDKRLLDGLEALLLAGRPKSSMVWCVIEHTDKGKRELHFVIVLFDLIFEKLIHPYIDRIDRYGFAAWVEHFALRHGLEIASDKLRIRPPFEHLRIPKCEVEFLLEVWEDVDGWVRAGEVGCRDDLDVRLAREGRQVRCFSYKGRPLQQPEIIGPGGKKLRLKNSIYYRSDFGSPCRNPTDRSKPEAVKARIAELRSFIHDRMEFRAHHLIGRLFGVCEKRLVAKGKARQRLQELIDQKLEPGRNADRLWQHIDLGYLWKAADLIKSGVPTIIDETKKTSVGELSIMKRAETKTAVEVGETSISQPEVTAASPTVIAEPEAFQPPSSGELDTIEGPLQAPDAPAEKRVRKRRSREVEIDLPGIG